MIRSTGLQKTLSLILAMVLLVSIMTPAAVSGNEDKASGMESETELSQEFGNDTEVTESVDELPDSPELNSDSLISEENPTDTVGLEPDQADAAEVETNADMTEAEEDSVMDEENDAPPESAEELVLTDDIFGVTVTIPYDAMPEGAARENIGLTVRNLTVQELEEFSSEVRAARSMIQWAYDITLVHRETGEELQPAGPVMVTVGEAIDDEVTVVRIEDEGGYTELEAETDGEETSFETEHFSRYGGVNFFGSLAYYGWTIPNYQQFVFAYYENKIDYTAFCIQVEEVFQTDNGYVIHYELTSEQFGQLASHSAAISAEDFMRLKRMLYLYETEYKDLKDKTYKADGTYDGSAYNFNLDVLWGEAKNNEPLRLYTSVGQYDTAASGGYQALEMKHWALFQAILHNCLDKGFTDANIKNGRKYYFSGYTNDTGDRFRERYAAAANDTSKDQEINSKYVFLVAEKEGNQNAIIIKPKTDSIETTVQANNLYSTNDSVLVISSGSQNQQTVAIPVKDIVKYTGLTANAVYHVESKLYEVSADGTTLGSLIKEVTSVHTPQAADGQLTVDFGNLILDAGKSYVVYEKMTSAGNVLDTDGNGTPDAKQTLEHADSADYKQTFRIASARTTLTASAGEKTSTAAENSAAVISGENNGSGVRTRVTDTIAYKNLPAGKEYSVTAALYKLNEAEGQYSLGENVIAKTQTVEIGSANGTIPVDLGTVDLPEGRYIIYETMESVENLIDSNGDGTPDTRHIITHEDIADKEQMLIVGETTEFRVYKSWEEGLDKEPVTIQLVKDGVDVEGESITLTGDEEVPWTYVWTGLEPGEYTAREISTSEAYAAMYPGTADREFVITEEITVPGLPETSEKWIKVTGTSDLQNNDAVVIVLERGVNLLSPYVGHSLVLNSSGVLTGTADTPAISEGEMTSHSTSDEWTVQSADEGFYLISNGKRLTLSSSALSCDSWNLDNNGMIYSQYRSSRIYPYYNTRDRVWTINAGSANVQFAIYRRVITETPGQDQTEVTEKTVSGTYYVIHNQPKPEVPTTSLAVRKVWGEGLTAVPVAVQLYRDGEYMETVWLSSENNWSYAWTELEGEKSEYTVKEVIPDNANYEASLATETGSLIIPSFSYNEWKKSGFIPGDPESPVGNGSEILLVTGDGRTMMQTNAAGIPSAPWTQVRLSTDSIRVDHDVVDLNQQELGYSVWKVEVDNDSVLLCTEAGGSRQYISGTGVLTTTANREYAARFVMDSDYTFYRADDAAKAKLGASSDGRLGFGRGTPLTFTAYCHLVGDRTDLQYEGEVRVITNTRKEVPFYELPSTGGGGSSRFSYLAVMLLGVCTVVGVVYVLRFRRRNAVKVRRR